MDQRRGLQAPGSDGGEHHRVFGLEERGNKGAHTQMARLGEDRGNPGT